jgi:hypothetical protein
VPKSQVPTNVLPSRMTVLGLGNPKSQIPTLENHTRARVNIAVLLLVRVRVPHTGEG